MSLSAAVSPIKKQSSSNTHNSNNGGTNVSFAAHDHHHNNNQQNCTICSERGFVTKTATPRFPHKEPPPPPPAPKVCHGCVERAAILEEVAGLREMVHTLSAGMMELHERVSVQKQRILDLESEVLDQKRHNSSLATTQAQPQPNITSASHPQAANQATQVSDLLEKMLNNNLPAMEARILTQVRKKELEHNSMEFKNIRADLERRSSEISKDFEKSLRTFDSKVTESEKQIKETVKQNDRRIVRAVHQLAQLCGVASPQALANINFNNSTTTMGGGGVGGFGQATNSVLGGSTTMLGNGSFAEDRSGAGRFNNNNNGVANNNSQGRSDSVSTSNFDARNF